MWTGRRFTAAKRTLPLLNHVTKRQALEKARETQPVLPRIADSRDDDKSVIDRGHRHGAGGRTVLRPKASPLPLIQQDRDGGSSLSETRPAACRGSENTMSKREHRHAYIPKQPRSVQERRSAYDSRRGAGQYCWRHLHREGAIDVLAVTTPVSATPNPLLAYICAKRAGLTPGLAEIWGTGGLFRQRAARPRSIGDPRRVCECGGGAVVRRARGTSWKANYGAYRPEFKDRRACRDRRHFRPADEPLPPPFGIKYEAVQIAVTSASTAA